MADVLVTRGPPLQPGPGFYKFGALVLGLEKDFPFTLHRRPESSQSPWRDLEKGSW